jgi:glycosyltransferase involved in cell wall biosynthesis
MKKRYLFLTITQGFAGAEHMQLDYLKFIDYDKYSVTLGVKKDVFSPHLKKNNLPVALISLPALDEKDRFFMKFLKYYKFFNAIKPHCIAFNQYWLKSFTLAEIIAASLITKGNAYMIVHDCPPVYPKYKGKLYFGFLPELGFSWRMCRLFQTLLGYFTKTTIAVSKAARDALVKLHKFPNSNVTVVYHGVDIHKYIPSGENRIKMRSEFNIVESDRVIVTTSMFWQNKRLDRLVEAFAILAWERKDIHWLAAGKGSECVHLKSMVDYLDEGVRKRIKFLGYREDIPLLLQLSDIYVLPSDSEGLSLGCLEAMSCGLISIVTDCGGTAEIIKHGYNGFLVEKSCAGVLNGLRRTLNLSAAEKEEMSKNSRRFIEEKFNLERNIRFGLKVLKLNNG